MTHAEQTIANHPRMMSIREIAKTGLLPEHTLRQMEKQKMLQKKKLNHRKKDYHLVEVQEQELAYLQ